MTRLPPEAYFDHEWFETECKTLFASSWVFAGVASDVSNPGDYFTISTGVFPLLIVRGKQGSLSAFHNTCRHRGAILVEKLCGNTGKSLVCPYHRWTYGLDGALKGAPEMAACFEGLDRGSYGLKPASIGVFKDLLFVNPNPEADFDNWISTIANKAWPHDLGSKELREGARLHYDLECDWKIFIENALDGYHLAYLHEQTLGGPVHSQNIWERYGENMIWYATDEGKARHRIPAKIRRETTQYPKLRHAQGVEYGGVYFLFPSTLIVPTPFGLSVSSLIPIKSGRSRMTVRHWVGPGQNRDERKYIPGYDKKTDTISSENWTKRALEYGDFQTEDVWICERVQKGIESPAYEPGPLAKGAGAEDPIRWFHENLYKVSN